jgi:tetratricopeptide (TPR) repeat protein
MRCRAGNAPRHATALPGHFEGWFNLALAHQKSARWEQAAEAYEEPEMPEALLNLGRILESNGKSEEARACWSKALEAEPALAQGYFGPSMD